MKKLLVVILILMITGCSVEAADAPTPTFISCPICPTEIPPTPTPYWDAVPTDPVPYHFREGLPVFDGVIEPPGYPYWHVICAGWWWRQYDRTPLFRGPYWTDSLYLNDVVNTAWIKIVGIQYNAPNEIWLMVNGSGGWDAWVPFHHENCPEGICGELYYSDIEPPVTTGG